METARQLRRRPSMPIRIASIHRAVIALTGLFCPMVFPLMGMAQTPAPDEELVAAIDKAVEKSGVSEREPGVAVLIYQPGKLNFQKGYGLADLKSGKPITPRTLFELASVSKTFTATATLILHDRGKLSIDDDVRKYLPWLPIYQPDRPILIRDLLQHTSGLPDYMAFDDVPKSRATFLVNSDYFAMFAQRQKEFPLAFPTGAKYEYNNTNFMLLASIIERVDRRTFGTFLREEIFNPLGMHHSFVYEDPATIPDQSADCNHAVGYTWRKKKGIWDPSWGTPPARHEELLTVGDGGVWTNLNDMAMWDRAVRDEKLVKPATWKLALTPSKPRSGKPSHYGLGWSLYADGEDLYGYGHDGSWNGFETTYYRYLSEDRTTVLLSNRSTMDTNKLWTALDRIVGKRLAK